MFTYININFLFHPFPSRGELRNFGLSVSASALFALLSIFACLRRQKFGGVENSL